MQLGFEALHVIVFFINLDIATFQLINKKIPCTCWVGQSMQQLITLPYNEQEI